jgi:metal-dependent amidase/aminoacylase/carboxypeptidase family protein
MASSVATSTGHPTVSQSDSPPALCFLANLLNLASTAIPASSQLLYGIRAPTAKDLAPLVPRVLSCFAAGALATGCSYMKEGQNLYLELQQNRGLARVFSEYAQEEWGSEGYQTPESVPTTASTDFVFTFSPSLLD